MPRKTKSSRSSGQSEHSSRMTADHDEIRRWAEERGGKPACVKGTGGSDDIGLLRLDFPGYSGGESVQEITWDEFFDKFDERDLAMVYQEETAGGEKSNFNKLINRDEADKSQGGSHGRSRSRSTRSKSSGGGSSASKRKSAGRHGRDSSR